MPSPKSKLILRVLRVVVFFCVLLIIAPHIVKALETMDVDDITPGMKGYGKTVFLGTKIESFEIEVLGVLRNWEARSDMILVKMTGGPLEKTGIIAGMSGSPVYIDNKLIGAVSHGWTFSKDAIAGVTPIKEMTNILKMASDTEVVSHTRQYKTWRAPISSQGPEIMAKLMSHGMLNKHQLSQNDDLLQPFTIDLVPIHTPIMVSGFDNRSLKNLNPLFCKLGWFPFQGTSTGTSTSESTGDFVPGAAVAVELIRGDLSAAAVGTVTYREGNRILAFGHPLIQTGTTALPMSSAYVYTILASQSTSVKMAGPVEVIGSITQDRRAGIYGEIGKFTQMVPCQAEIRGALNVKYNFEIVHDSFLTPNLLQMAVESALLSTEKSLGEKLVNLKLDINIDGREKPVTVENIYYEPGPSWFPVFMIVHPVATLLNNQFQTVKIKSLNLVADILDSKKIASIESIKVSKKWVKPGDEIIVNVSLKSFTQEYITIPMKVKIPEDIKRGSRIKVTVCDAAYSEMRKRSGSHGNLLPTNFEQLINYVEDVENNKNVIMKIRMNKKGLTYKGESFPSLPNSYLNIMSQSNQSGVAGLQGEMVKRVQTDWYITGRKSISLFVENNH